MGTSNFTAMLCIILLSATLTSSGWYEWRNRRRHGSRHMLARRSEHTSGHRSGHTSGHRSRNCGFLDRVECAEPTNPTDGTVLYSQRGFESKATYSCHSGFELLGDDTRTCLSDETWSGATPTCVFTAHFVSNLVGNHEHRFTRNDSIKGCGTLTAPSHGDISYTGRQPGDNGTIICDQGYTLTGPGTRTCHVGGWDRASGDCVSVSCPVLSSPSDGSVTQLASPVFEDVVSYSCDLGYALNGTNSRYCLSTGAWSGDDPTCVFAGCETLMAPTHGDISYTGCQPGDYATIICDQGYTLTGPGARTCNVGGWDGASGDCVRISCPGLSSPSHGSVTQLASPLFEDVVSYSCDPGYALDGTNSRSCLSTGAWSGDNPTCVFAGCGTLTAPTHGDISYTGRQPGDNATIICDQGYTMTGPGTRTCLVVGWDGASGDCVRVTCPGLSSPSDGSVTQFSSPVFEDVVSYSCDPGYVLDGTNSRSCLSTGAWSGDDPTCVFAGCGTLTAPKHGDITYTGRQTGDNATIKCDQGYTLTGPGARTCLVGGWDRASGDCVRVSCPVLSSPSDGSVTLLVSPVFEDVVSYSCDLGYALNGTNSRYCLSTGAWSGDDPTCVFAGCETLMVPTHGDISYTGRQPGDNATIICDQGYTLTGPGDRTCHVGGWDGASGDCVRISCPVLSSPSDGSVTQLASPVFEDMVSYSCDLGYALNGTNSRYCLSTGAWSGDDPTCVVAGCGPLSTPEHGDISIIGQLLGHTATATCDTGYLVTGTAVRTCLVFGWSGTTAGCVPVSCPALTNPTGGSVSTPDGAEFQKEAVYSCSPGYELDGDRRRCCGSTGSWSGDAPTCLQTVVCPNLPAPMDGTISVSGTQPLGSVATYTCTYGLDMGDLERHCLTGGVWSGSPATCYQACPSLSPPMYGDLRLNGFSVGKTAVVSCDTGYVLTGSSVRQCTSSGWDGTEADCVPVPCPALSNPDDGSVSTVGGNQFLAEANFSCNPGFELSGCSHRSCLSTGLWSGDAPTCVETVQCPAITAPDNGTFELIGAFSLGTIATYSCDLGLVSGDLVRYCVAGGTWTGTEPTCSTDVNECLEPTTCKNGATCQDLDGDFNCICTPGYEGKDCGNNINECLEPTTCKNGATCQDLDGDFKCICTPGYEGKDCGINKNECLEPTTCKNGATCQDLDGDFNCICTPGYEGKDCGNNKNECLEPTTCKNGAKCQDLDGDFNCICTPGYEGKDCGNNKNECLESSTCKNGATCQDLDGDFNCICTPGYEGKDCGTNKNECLEPTTCKNGATCQDLDGDFNCICTPGYEGKDCGNDINECLEPTTCKNGASCQDLDGDFKCICTPGYEGKDCGKNKNECLEPPTCKNGATCQDLDGDFNCICTPGYEGKDCGTNINECLEPTTCKNGATCQDLDGDFNCICTPGYEGKDCGNGRLNVALGGTVTMSSLFTSTEKGDGTWAYAVDGNTNQDWYNGGCASSIREADPWLLLDLRGTFTVTALKIYNRADGSVVEYIGCYKDTSNRDLDGELIYNHYDNTPQKCISVCKDKGYAYSSVQAGGWCLCGDSYGKFGPLPEISCSSTCTGDPSLTCGGPWANAVYRISHEADRLEDLSIQFGSTTTPPEISFYSGTFPLVDTIEFDQPYTGRYLRLSMNKTEFLTICELELYGFVENELVGNCNDVYDSISTKPVSSGVYTVYPCGNATCPVSLYCDMTTDGEPWTVIQRRVGNSTDFYRNWTDYRDGFGDPSANFWLGNENIHTITSQGSYELRVDLEDFEGNTAFAEYSSFSVGPESDKYRLSVSGYQSGSTAGDSLTSHNNQQFSTQDSDNDKSSTRSCAYDTKGAWWFDDCLESNLNGLFLEGAISGQFGKGVNWYSWKGSTYSVKSVMMIREMYHIDVLELF